MQPPSYPIYCIKAQGRGGYKVPVRLLRWVVGDPGFDGMIEPHSSLPVFREG